MSSLSVNDLKDKLGLAENDDDDQRHKFLMKHILQLEAEIAGLKQQLDEERIQFSSYVDQISRLNGTKEELILEYESREREMQQEIFSLQQQLQSYRNSETRDMLMNQGLIDIADSTPGQQVAHLLIDRARLMDVIEELKERIVNRSTRNVEIKFAERDFLSDEMSQQSASNIGELLSKVQHLEINNKLLLEKLAKVSPNNRDDHLGSTGVVCKSSEQAFKSPATMEEAVERLKVAEVKVQRVESLERELVVKEAEIKKLSSQLDLLSNHNTGPKDEELVCSRDDRNSSSEFYSKHGDKIEVMLKSVEEQLMSLRSFSDQKKTDDETSLNSNQLKVLQKEFELLKVELVKMISKYDSQAIKYRDHKLNCKNKLFKFKEAFKKEKQELLEKVEELQNRLELNSEVMSREVEYKKNLEKTVQNLILEQRNFMTQISVQEETILNQKREISILSTKSKQFQIEISSDKHVSFSRTSDQASITTE